MGHTNRYFVLFAFLAFIGPALECQAEGVHGVSTSKHRYVESDSALQASAIHNYDDFRRFLGKTGPVQLKDWIGSIPYGGGTRACLYFSSAALMGGLMRQAACKAPDPKDGFEVSSRDLLNQATGSKLPNGFNFWTEMPERFKQVGWALAREAPHENLNWNWYPDGRWKDPGYARPQVHHELPEFTHETLFSHPGRFPREKGGISWDEVAQLVTALKEHQSPVLFSYAPPFPESVPEKNRWWHTSVLVGVDPSCGFLAYDSSFGPESSMTDTPPGKKRRDLRCISFTDVQDQGKHAASYFLTHPKDCGATTGRESPYPQPDGPAPTRPDRPRLSPPDPRPTQGNPSLKRTLAQLQDAEVRRVLPTVQPSAAKLTDFQGKSLGSGVVIAPEGTILTHAKAALAGGPVKIQLPDGREYEVKCQRKDPHSVVDLAHCYPTTRQSNVPFSKFAKNKPKPGDKIFTVGNPSDANIDLPSFQTSVGKVIEGGTGGEMVHTAWTHLGSGGGPLFNKEGEIVGIHLGRMVKNSPERRAASLDTIRTFLAMNGEAGGHPGGRPTTPSRPLPPNRPNDGGREPAGTPRTNSYLERDLNRISDEAVKKILPFTQPASVAIGGGSGACISKDGTILTVAHVARTGQNMTVTFPDGTQYKVRCSPKELSRDLDVAICRPSEPVPPNLPFVRIAKEEPAVGSTTFLIGQPAQTDSSGRPTGYRRFDTEVGTIKRYGRREPPLGGLIHTAWTYWGHSGAPMFNLSGEIIGMHNSWQSDKSRSDTYGERHGVRLNDIRELLDKLDLKEEI